MTTTKVRARPSTTAHEVIKVLDVHMRATGMTRQTLAKKSGVSERALTNWWCGKVDPCVALLEAALGVFELRLKVAAK